MNHDPSEVRSKLREFLTHELIRDPQYPLQDDEALIKSGLIDSFALAQVGLFVEENFNVYIPDPDLNADDMNTLDQMVARVLRG